MYWENGGTSRSSTVLYSNIFGGGVGEGTAAEAAARRGISLRYAFIVLGGQHGTAFLCALNHARNSCIPDNSTYGQRVFLRCFFGRKYLILL